MVHRAWPRGATQRPRSGAEAGKTPHPRSGAAADSARLRRRRNSQEELPHIRGQGRWPGGATPHPRSGAVAERSNPTSREQWLRQHRSA